MLVRNRHQSSVLVKLVETKSLVAMVVWADEVASFLSLLTVKHVCGYFNSEGSQTHHQLLLLMREVRGEWSDWLELTERQW